MGGTKLFSWFSFQLKNRTRFCRLIGLSFCFINLWKLLLITCSHSALLLMSSVISQRPSPYLLSLLYNTIQYNTTVLLYRHSFLCKQAKLRRALPCLGGANYCNADCRALWARKLLKVPTWRLERDSNPRPFGRKATNLPMSHHAPSNEPLCLQSLQIGLHRNGSNNVKRKWLLLLDECNEILDILGKAINIFTIHDLCLKCARARDHIFRSYNGI